MVFVIEWVYVEQFRVEGGIWVFCRFFLDMSFLGDGAGAGFGIFGIQG